MAKTCYMKKAVISVREKLRILKIWKHKRVVRENLCNENLFLGGSLERKGRHKFCPNLVNDLDMFVPLNFFACNHHMAHNNYTVQWGFSVEHRCGGFGVGKKSK